MILEVAVLYIVSEKEKEFERDFKLASQFISLTKGYITHTLNKCLEHQEKYLLLVQWESLEDHTEGFRKSPQYQQWKKLLHHYYDPFPIVEHYSNVFESNLDK